MRVTVLGATGIIGQALLPQLAAEHDVVAVSRSRRPSDDGVAWVQADAATGAGIDAALDGAEVVYHLVHSLGRRDFERQDRLVAGNVSRRAAAAGVKQIVYLVKRLPVMVTPSWVSTPTQPIALDDIARYLAGVAGNPDALGAAFDAGGPEVMTYRQMIERIAALLGRRPRIVEVPVLTPALSALWLELVTPVRSSVARPLVEGLRNPTIAREQRLRELVPLELTPFDAAARKALGR
jgi:uncharacterized protein YbjT (DUF2867 family)